jgi:hypothetical protein
MLGRSGGDAAGLACTWDIPALSPQVFDAGLVNVQHATHDGALHAALRVDSSAMCATSDG